MHLNRIRGLALERPARSHPYTSVIIFPNYPRSVEVYCWKTGLPGLTPNRGWTILIVILFRILDVIDSHRNSHPTPVERRYRTILNNSSALLLACRTHVSNPKDLHQNVRILARVSSVLLSNRGIFQSMADVLKNNLAKPFQICVGTFLLS